jgi:hypothetical protein
LPTGHAIPSNDETTENDEEDPYRPLKSWYYLETAEDIGQLSRWTLYLARKAARAKSKAAEQVRLSQSPKKSPNRLGQTYAVEIVSPRQRPQGPKPIDYDMENVRCLTVELKQAADWIESRYEYIWSC